MPELSPNQQLANATPEGSSVLETVKKKEGPWTDPVGESGLPKGSPLGCTPNPFKGTKG